MEFLQAIAPQLAELLRAAADYLDGGEELADFEEPVPAIHLNEHGEVVYG